ncbi:unnamed protein product, partial [marine sediment metagenome]
GAVLLGATPQPINEFSAVQRHPIGARKQVGQRVYHYAHVAPAALGGVQLVPSRGAVNLMTNRERGTDVVGAYPVGSKVIRITAINDVLENEFAGGMLLYADEDNGWSCHAPIVANSAATIGNIFTVWLEYGIPYAMTDGYNSTCIANPFWNVARATANWGYTSVVGVPELHVPVDNFTWLQTWGPCMCVGTGGTGGNPNERTVTWDDDGCVQLSASHSTNHQFAGFLVHKTWFDQAPAFAGAQGYSFNVINI